MDCPQCSKSFSDSDGLVTHLTNAHNISRIEARKRVIELSDSRDSDQEETPANSPGKDGASNSNRQVMLNRFRRQYDALGRMPTPHELDEIDGYSREDYINEFGSVYGTAVFAGLTDLEPGRYDHDADGSKQYSEWDLISELWRVFELTGRASVRMMDHAGEYSSQTYQYRFGSWSEALNRANIDGPDPSIPASRDSRQKHYASAEWKELRTQALKRDDYECQSCGISEEKHQEKFGVGLNVHHLTDIAEFEDPADADVVENLETLCAECHGEHHPFSEK
jgi:hypothetical protein